MKVADKSQDLWFEDRRVSDEPYEMYSSEKLQSGLNVRVQHLSDGSTGMPCSRDIPYWLQHQRHTDSNNSDSNPWAGVRRHPESVENHTLDDDY